MGCVEREVGSLYYEKFQNTLTCMRKVGGLIFCPPAQFQTINSDYKRLVYQLTDRGKSMGPIVAAMREWGKRHTSRG